MKSGLKNTLFKFIETVRIDMAEKGALDEIFDCSINRWTQPTCTCPVAQFINTFTDETANEWRLTTKDEGFSSAEVGDSRPQTPPSSSFSDKSDRWKHRCKP